jgi:hypothetical protein
VYFANPTVLDSKDDVLGIDSTLFGDILCISRVGTFLLDTAVGDVRPTLQYLVVIHSDSKKPMAACLQRENPLGSFDADSTQRFTRSVPLYFIDDSMDDSTSFNGLACLCGYLSSTL